MPKTLVEYPKCIVYAIENLEGGIALIKSWAEDMQLYETMIEHFKDLPGLIRCNLQVDRFGADITFTINDMREMVHVRRWLREHGHPAPTTTDYAVAQQRVFMYYPPGHAPLYLRAQLPFEEGAVCKYVAIGTEQKPIYELQCEGKVIEDKEEVLEDA